MTARRDELVYRIARRSSINPQGCWQWNGATDQFGYGSISVDGKTERVHRLAYTLFVGKLEPRMMIDHLCFNEGCFNPAHLRQVTCKQNQEHRSGPQKNSKSGIRGVHLDTKSKRWYARMAHNKRVMHIGSFATKEEAAEAVSAARARYFTHDDANLGGKRRD